MPVVNGANHDEGRLFVFGAYDAGGHPLTAEQYPVALRNSSGDAADRILARYPLSAYPSPGLALSAVRTDQLVSCPVLDVNALVRRHSPAYTYEFTDETSPPFESLRDLHTDFVGGAPERRPSPPGTPVTSPPWRTSRLTSSRASRRCASPPSRPRR